MAKIQLPQRVEAWLAVILGIAAIVVIGLQIHLSAQPLSARETALFGIMQFLFSVGFAFVLARVSSHREFKESQKQFAIAAYRRIKEIERGIDRLIGKTEPGAQTSEATQRSLDVVHEIARGIRDTTASSIADWGDIIGEEIVAIEKIESLRAEGKASAADKNQGRDVRGLVSKLRIETEEIRGLLDRLPYSLRIMSDEDARRSIRQEYRENLMRELALAGGVEIGCYVDESMDMDAFRNLTVGERLSVAIEDLDPRVASLIARDGAGRPVGALMNNHPLSHGYGEFVIEFVTAMQSSRLEAVVTEICDTATEEDEHPCHFKVCVLAPKRLLEDLQQPGLLPFFVSEAGT